jgi:hypothetical protein
MSTRTLPRPHVIYCHLQGLPLPLFLFLLQRLLRFLLALWIIFVSWVVSLMSLFLFFRVSEPHKLLARSLHSCPLFGRSLGDVCDSYGIILLFCKVEVDQEQDPGVPWPGHVRFLRTVALAAGLFYRAPCHVAIEQGLVGYHGRVQKARRNEWAHWIFIWTLSKPDLEMPPASRDQRLWVAICLYVC